jgi:hypothetical protein
MIRVSVSSGILPEKRVVAVLLAFQGALVMETFYIIDQFGSDYTENKVFQERHTFIIIVDGAIIKRA